MNARSRRERLTGRVSERRRRAGAGGPAHELRATSVAPALELVEPITMRSRERHPARLRPVPSSEASAYEVLLQTIDDAVLVVDLTSGRLLRGNEAAWELLGYEPGLLGVRGFSSLFAPGQASSIDALLAELRLTGSAQRPELLLQRADGTCFWGELRGRAHPSLAGRRCLLLIRDVSAAVERERELRRLRAELDAANAHMQHTNKLVALGQLAAGVAHELNNPASYVLMNLDEIRGVLERAQVAHKTLRTSLLAWLDGEQRERAEECLSTFPAYRVFHEGHELVAECIDGVQRITSLVKDLRGFARIDERDVSLVSLNDVVRTACKMVGSHLRQRAHLRTELGSTRQLAADRRRLVQVVTNLLMNAGQAVEGGKSEEQVIEVTTLDTADSVVLRVRDTGSGIPPELQQEIFEPFFTTKREGGTGLGLSVISDIVRQHSGTVSVESLLGDGALFQVTIPFETGLHPAGPEAHRPPVAAAPGAARVLVIDDEPHLVRAYQRVLSRHHHVTVATGGAAGLALIEKDPDYDAILCDLTMPDVDGVRIYRCLDRVAPHLKSRVIFSSGGACSRRAEELLSSGEVPLLEKPVDSAKLLAAIERVRGARRSG